MQWSGRVRGVQGCRLTPPPQKMGTFEENINRTRMLTLLTVCVYTIQCIVYTHTVYIYSIHNRNLISALWASLCTVYVGRRYNRTRMLASLASSARPFVPRCIHKRSRIFASLAFSARPSGPHFIHKIELKGVTPKVENLRRPLILCGAGSRSYLAMQMGFLQFQKRRGHNRKLSTSAVP